MPKKADRGAASKVPPRGPQLKIGDRVRILDISADLKDPNYELQDRQHREMRTAGIVQVLLESRFHSLRVRPLWVRRAQGKQESRSASEIWTKHRLG